MNLETTNKLSTSFYVYNGFYIVTIFSLFEEFHTKLQTSKDKKSFSSLKSNKLLCYRIDENIKVYYGYSVFRILY